MGFQQSRHDYSLFTRIDTNCFMALLVYLDDILVMSNNMEAIADLEKTLHALFCIKHLGNVRYFLGMEIDRNGTGITVTQKKYAFDMLKGNGSLESKPVSTPTKYSMGD